MSSLYFLAILPPEDLSRQIHEIRLDCAAKFGVQKALNIPVHITLYRPFRLEEAFEKNFNRLMASLAQDIPRFSQKLENMEAFETHAVVINALKNDGIIQLHRSIATVFRKHGIDKQPPGRNNLPFRPHISIAYRDILPEVFPLIWNEYKEMKFKRSFTVTQFSLLKHDGTVWIPVKDFSLGSASDQASLFAF